jgi:phosphate transport system substrate-binding protein
VIDGAVMAADVSSMMAASLDMGNELTIGVTDMGVTVNDATVVAADIAASNGVIHGIDQVLLPPMELPEVVPSFVEGAIIAAGSSTVFPLSEEVVNRWVEEGGPQSITLDSIGSGAGYERFCVAGESDIANASRAIRETEVESCHAIDRDVFPIRVGTDALAVVVNSENTFASEMTLAELALVFSTASTWQDVNPEWPAEPIERFIPGTDSGTFDYFVEEVFDEDEAPILAAENTSLSEDDNVLVTGVTGNPYAIGFFGFSYFAANEGSLNAVAIEAVAPNAANVNAGTYPLARPLFMYSAPEIIAEKAQVGEFLSYYLSVVNEEVVDADYFPAPAYALNRASFYVAAAIDMAMM